MKKINIILFIYLVNILFFMTIVPKTIPSVYMFVDFENIIKAFSILIR